MLRIALLAAAVGTTTFALAQTPTTAAPQAKAAAASPAPPSKAASPAKAAAAPSKPKDPPPVARNAATGLPRNMTRVTEVEGITEYKLDNGLTVLMLPDASKPTMTVNVTYRVGSRHENYGETGMAHLLEHLVFKGTPKFPSIDKDFNARGARSNGTTWLDRTNYFELLQSTDDNLKWAIEMEADRMVNSFIAKKDLDSEMTVVRNEYEAGENQPVQVMLKRLQSIAFDWHSYGRSTIGNRSDIENVKIENLQAFYRMYYQPDNATLIVAGKFDEAKARGWIAQYFGAIPKPTRALPAFWTVEPTQDGERQFFVRRKGEMQMVMVAYKVPSGLHPHSTGIALANFALGDTPSGRLHKALVEPGKAAQVFGFPLQGVYPGIHIFAAIVKKGDAVEPVRDEIARVVEDFYKTPMTSEELERAKKAFANSSEKTLNDHERIGIGLSEYIALGDWRLFFVGRDKVAAATVDNATEAGRAYYRRDNRTVGIYVPEDAPQRAEVPQAPTVAQVMQDFKPKAAVAKAEAFDPSPDNIDKRTTRDKVGGMRVALLPKQNRGEAVNVSINLNWGDEKSLAGTRYASNIVYSMLTRGTSKMSRTQISDEMDKLKMEGGIWSYQTTRSNLVASLKFVAHVLKEANFPQSEFDQVIKQQLTGVESQRSEPAPRAFEAIGQHFNGQWPKTDPRYSPTLDEQIEGIKAVTLDQVKAHHKQFFGASLGEIAIVGDFDAAEARKAIADSFAGWASAAPYTRVANVYRDVAPINRWINTPDKENGSFLARINVELKNDDPDFLPLFLANHMMGGGAGLNSRLAERIRQKDGLSYGIGSGLNAPSQDRAGSWSVNGIAAPQNLAKVEAAFFDEINKALKDGFTQEEIDRAKTGALQLRQQQRAQDQSVAAAWRSNLYLNRTFAFTKVQDERIKALTKAEIDAAFRKYIIPAKITVIKAGDEVKAKTASAPANLNPADKR